MSLTAVGVLRPCQQIKNMLVLQHEPHKGPGDGHVCRAKIDGQVVQPGALCAQMFHSMKEKEELLPVHIFGAGGDVGRW